MTYFLKIRSTALVAMALFLASCTSAPPVNHLAEFRAQLQYSVDAYKDPDMLRSALTNLETHGLTVAKIEKQASIARLAMEHHPQHFQSDVSELNELLANQPLHRINKSVQAIAYLGRAVRGQDSDRATSTVKSDVKGLCGNPVETASTLLTSGNARVRQEADFNYQLSSACFMVVRGESDRSTRYMIRAYSQLGARPDLETVLLDAGVRGGIATDAVTVFIHQMALRGYNLNLPLRSDG